MVLAWAMSHYIDRMKWSARLFGLVLAVGSMVSPVWAAQTSFSARYLQAQVVFDYRWQVRGAPEQALRFVLPIADVEQGQREFQSFSNQEANEEAFQEVKKEAARRSSGLYDIDVVRTRDGFEVKGAIPRGVDPQPLMDALRRVRDDAVKDYIARHFYMQVDELHVMPDHKKVAGRYAPALAPLAAAVRQQTARMSAREQVNWLLGFFQTIPYDQLLNRYTSNGAGFQTPYGLLLKNRGDCDTKSVALASLLRSLYPGLRLVMVYVPEHAFIGIGLPQGTGDYALRLGGVPFVLADPTGPAELKLGEVDRRALTYLNSGTYSYQEIP